MKILFLGCGNMGSSIAKGIYENNPNYMLLTHTPSGRSAKSLAQAVNGTYIQVLNKDSLNVDIIFIGCKPQQFPELREQLKGLLIDKTIIISIMAGYALEDLKSYLQHQRIVKFMPNTPIKVNAGTGIIHYSTDLNKIEKQTVDKLFQGLSDNIEVGSEEDMNKLMLVFGSGPAFVYEFLSYMKKAYLADFSDKEKEIEINLLKLFKASSELALIDGEPIQNQIDRVTSKGGVTIAALTELRSQNIDSVLKKAFDKGVERSIELSHS